jgi:hypothetical protein
LKECLHSHGRFLRRYYKTDLFGWLLWAIVSGFVSSWINFAAQAMVGSWPCGRLPKRATGNNGLRASSRSDADRSFVRRAAFIKIRLPAKDQVIRAAQRDGDCDPEKKVL